MSYDHLILARIWFPVLIVWLNLACMITRFVIFPRSFCCLMML